MRILQIAMIGVFFVIGGSVRLSGQMLPASSPPWATQMPNTTQKSDDSQRTEQQEKVQITARQKQLIAYTNKLLSLATNLKAQADRSNTGTLSVDMIKKADEIEKLARGVKNQVKR